MRSLAVGFGRGFPRVWLLPIGLLTLILGVAAVGGLSRSIAADLIAWWPVWLGLAVAAYLLRERNVGLFRVAGLIPLAALVLVVLFLSGHLAGWSIMPSAAQRLVGPLPDAHTDAALDAEIDGEIGVTGGSDYLYRVEPSMGGGGIGIPVASEQIVDSSVSIALEPPSDPGLYSYAGWDLALSESPRWSLSLSGSIDADLSSLDVDELSVEGSGVVRLGETDTETPVSVGGTVRVIVPPQNAARVVGQASVPESWTVDTEGAASPVIGNGWVITAEPGSSVTVSVG